MRDKLILIIINQNDIQLKDSFPDKNNLNTIRNSFKDYIYLLFLLSMFSNYLHVPSDV